MKIKLSPQVRDNNKIWYEIEENVITATMNGVTDTFSMVIWKHGSSIGTSHYISYQAIGRWK